MNEQPAEQDMLARLADAFAEQAVPAGPSEAVKARLKATLEQRSKRSTAARPVRTRFFGTSRGSTMQKVMSIAAVLAVVAIGALVATHAGSSGSAFAAMIDRINEIRTVRFEMQTKLKDAGPDAQLHATVTLSKPWSRFETSAAGLKVVRITNADEGKTLTLFQDLKKAQLGSSNGKGLGNGVDKLRNLPKQGAESLGKESVGGVEALKYRQVTKGDYHTVWIDPATQLPVQLMIADAAEPSAATITATFSNFQWNLAVDPSQLTLEPPAGYEVTTGAEE